MQKFTKSKIAYGIIFIVAIICIIFIFLKSSSADPIAQIWADGQLVQEIDLLKATDTEFSIKTVTFKIENHQIRFLSSDCPDKICVNTGYIHNPTESAHCLPNKVSLTIR